MRLKIIVGNLVIVAAVGLISYFVVRSQLETDLGRQVEMEISNDSTLFGRSWRLTAAQFEEHTAIQAKTGPVRDAFDGLELSVRRTRAHLAANGVASWFGNPARGRLTKPDLVAITDETGTVVARDQDLNRMHGMKLASKFPRLKKVLSNGVVISDLWRPSDDNKYLHTAVAPIRSENGAVIGALVVAYDISDGYAKSEAEILGREIAFVIGHNVYSSSLRQFARDELNEELNGGLKSNLDAALDGGVSTTWQVGLASTDWVGKAEKLPGVTAIKASYVVMANRSQLTGYANATTLILVLTLLGAILVLVYGYIIASSFERPLETIEDGVLQVINGASDVRLDIESPEFGGLAYRINQLINVFTGVEETTQDASREHEGPSAETESNAGSAWTGGSSQPPPGTGGDADGGVIDDPAVAARVVQENEETYTQRLYQEYVHAKTNAGESVAHIPMQKFAERLNRNAETLSKRYGVSRVRFQVETSGTQVMLKPILIRQ